MATKTIECTIEGISPLLMNRYPLEPIEAMDKKSKEEQAEIAAYRMEEGRELFIPATNLQRALISGATFSKGKGRASLQRVTSSCLMVTPEHLGLNRIGYEIDARPVVNPTTKGKVIKYRPRLEKWKVSFTVEYDDSLLTKVQIRKIIDDTGKLVGLLDFRPERKGSFGRFQVVKWS